MGAELGKRHVQGFQAGLHDVVNRLIDLVFVERLLAVDKEFEQFRQSRWIPPPFSRPSLGGRNRHSRVAPVFPKARPIRQSPY